MNRLKFIVFCLCASQIASIPTIEYDGATSESINNSEIRDTLDDHTTELSTTNSTDIETTTELINAIATTDADIAANLVKTDVEARFKKDDDNFEIFTQYPRGSVIRDYDEEICDDLAQNDDKTDQISTTIKPILLNKPTTYHPKFGSSESTSNGDVITTERTTTEITTENAITRQNFATTSISEGVPTEVNTPISIIPTDQAIGSDVTSSTSVKYEVKGFNFETVPTSPPDFGLVTSTTPSNAEVWRYHHFNVPNPNKSDKHVFSRFGFGTKFNGFSSTFTQPELTTSMAVSYTPTTFSPPPKFLFPNLNRFNIAPTSVYPHNLITTGEKLSTSTIFPTEFSTTTFKNDIVSTTSPPPKFLVPNYNGDLNRFGIVSTPSYPNNLITTDEKLSTSTEFSTTTFKNGIVSTTSPPPKFLVPNYNGDLNRFSIVSTSSQLYPNNLVSTDEKLPTSTEFSTTTFKNDIVSTTSPPPKFLVPNYNGDLNRFSIVSTSSQLYPNNLVSTDEKLPTSTEFSTTTFKNDIVSTTSPPPKFLVPNYNGELNRFGIVSTPSYPNNLITTDEKLSTSTEFSTTAFKNDIVSTTSPPPKFLVPNYNADLNRFSIVSTSSQPYPNNLLSTSTILPTEFSTTTLSPSPPQPTTPTDFSSTTISDLNNFNFDPTSSTTDSLITSFTRSTTTTTPKTNVIILNNPSAPQLMNRPTALNTNINRQYDVFNGIRTLPPQQITTTTTPFPIGRKIALTPNVNRPHPSIELFSRIGDQEARLPPMNRGKINLSSEILPPKFGGKSDTTTERLVKAKFSGKISFGNGTNPESKTGSFFDLQSIQSYNLAFVNSAPTNRFQPIKPRPGSHIFSTPLRRPEVIKPANGSPRFSLDLIDKYTSKHLKIDTVNLGKTGSINRLGNSRKTTFFNGLNIYNPSFATFLR